MGRMMPQAVLLLLAVAVSISVAAEGTGDEPLVRVSASSLNVREGPGTSHLVVGSAVRGEILALLEEREGWVRVRTEKGLVGWVSAGFVEPFRFPGEEPAPTSGSPEADTPGELAGEAEPKRGGFWIRRALKWGSLAGAGVAGALAYKERTAGDDAYEEYKTLARNGDPTAAEPKLEKAEDHDSRAMTYLIASGVLAGAFVVQQFILGGGSEETTAEERSGPLSFHWDPVRGEARAGLLLRRF